MAATKTARTTSTNINNTLNTARNRTIDSNSNGNIKNCDLYVVGLIAIRVLELMTEIETKMETETKALIVESEHDPLTEVRVPVL